MRPYSTTVYKICEGGEERKRFSKAGNDEAGLCEMLPLFLSHVSSFLIFLK